MPFIISAFDVLCSNLVTVKELKERESMSKNLKEAIITLPKAELHVHIEGTMEPEQFMLFAQRNNIAIPYATIQEAKKAYEFSDYQSFIDAYVLLTRVLCTQEDFYDLTIAYLKKAAAQGVVHAEIFFDLQTYMPRHIPAEMIIMGIHDALCDGKKLWGISGGMIMNFLRNLSAENAFEALTLSLPFKDKIVGIGLASVEKNNPPSKFKDVFTRARAYGYHCVAHAGECSSTMIRETIKLLHVDRIDHGIQAIHDPRLIKELVQKKIPLTVCPLSNVALGIIQDLQHHPLKKLIDAGVIVTLNSDDPAFFNGYIAENYYAAVTQMGLSFDDLVQCARNSFYASFASESRKRECLALLGGSS